MSQDLINRYKKSIRLQFQNEEMEEQYGSKEELRGRGSSVFAFGMLFIINIAFFSLEFRAFGSDTSVPMYGYLSSGLLALANALLSQFSKNIFWQNKRLLANGALSMCFVIVAVYLQKYSANHAAEMSLLIVWLGSLNALRLLYTSIVNAVFVGFFLVVLYLDKDSFFWTSLVSILLISATLLGGYLSYMLERQRRTIFLQRELTRSMNSRQESWGFALMDLDTELSGVLEFKEMIDLLKKHLELVIKFESYVLTSLQGQGPKPLADKVEGELFKNEDKTIWSQDLLDKLTQTRQATISAEHEKVKGFMGISRDRFTSYRLDVPVFSDSSLKGLISLRRSDDAFDDLDMIASVSIATQAMLIYSRNVKNSAIVLDSSVPDPVIHKANKFMPPGGQAATASNKTLAEQIPSAQASDIELTYGSDPVALSKPEPDQVLAPSDLINKLKAEEELTKKTITLLSRENADRVAIDKYQTATAEGEPLSILIIEVDGLSKLREQDGDQVAYNVFAAIVKYIFSKIEKDKDVLGRYGQNGLSVLMPMVDMNAAEKFAEQIRRFVARARYKTSYGEKSATLSIGVAAITDETGDFGTMVKRADMALFVAKKNGRNCVKVRL
ncbi:MAG: GGDEF domain-containing protein [Gammaproteobacteria bacterium]|nr:GGDEF domain-containing protein [Gammaproteobacteria bacterium]